MPPLEHQEAVKPFYTWVKPTVRGYRHYPILTLPVYVVLLPLGYGKLSQSAVQLEAILAFLLGIPIREGKLAIRYSISR